MKSKKPRWKPGQEMPHFSGKSYAELNDIYPINERIKDDAWKFMGLVYPAWVLTRDRFKDELKGKLTLSRFLELCYMQRCEEEREAFAFEPYTAYKGMNISFGIFWRRKAELTKLGLVENIPINNTPGSDSSRLYRVTGLGKMMIKFFADNLNQANFNLRMWASNDNLPDPTKRNKITYFLLMNYPEWKDGFKREQKPFKPKRAYVKTNHPRWDKSIK